MLPNLTDAEIDYIIMQQFKHEDELEALEKHYEQMDDLANSVKPRETNCWGCDKLDLNSKVDHICPECGWIICPDCNKCKPHCKRTDHE